MAGLTRILTLFCVAGCHLSAASPVLRSAQVVPVGQNATFSCNLTSSDEITWYRLRSDQLLPLLTVRTSKVGGQTVDHVASDPQRYVAGGALDTGSASLEILGVEAADAGLYFCTGRSSKSVFVNRGVLLTVAGADGDPVRDRTKQPCLVLGLCVLPGLLSLGFVLIVGLYLCTGKPALCCCGPVGGDSALGETEDGSLHYSSIKHADKPRPSVRGRKDDVTYAAVSPRRSPNGSQDHRGE